MSRENRSARPQGRGSRLAATVAATLCLLAAEPARAIIVYEDPGRLTTMPLLPGGVKPGWQYLGQFRGGFTGIPIGPRAWVTATHLATPTGTLFYANGGASGTTAYASTRAVVSGDLAVMTLDAGQPDFTLWAPVWSTPASLVQGQDIYMYGRGLPRGGVATNAEPVPGTAKGWYWDWAGADSRQSYGTNELDGLAIDGSGNIYIAMAFDAPTTTNGVATTEGAYADGDSGSGIFSLNPATHRWELLGINSTVDIVQETSGGAALYGAIYDARGYYDGTTLITGTAPVPLASYATSLPHKYSVVAPYIPLPEPASGGLVAVAALSLAGWCGRRTARARR